MHCSAPPFRGYLSIHRLWCLQRKGGRGWAWKQPPMDTLGTRYADLQLCEAVEGKGWMLVSLTLALLKGQLYLVRCSEGKLWVGKHRIEGQQFHRRKISNT